VWRNRHRGILRLLRLHVPALLVGVVTLYQDWAPFLVGVGFVFLRDGGMGVLSPQDLYSHRDAWERPWLWAAILGFDSGHACRRGHCVATERVPATTRRRAGSHDGRGPAWWP